MPTDEQLKKTQANCQPPASTPERLGNSISSIGIKPVRRTEPAEPHVHGLSAWDHRDLPDRHGWTLADYPQAVGERVMEFLAPGDPRWSLSLLGALGSRKTSLACAMVREYRKRFTPPYDGALAASFFAPEVYVKQIRTMPPPAWFFERCQATALLVLDDLGAGRSTPHVIEQIGFILRGRYNRDAKAKTIITSNLSLDDIGRQLDPRIADRLREGVTFNCGDKSKRVSGNFPITPITPPQSTQDDTAK